MEFELNYDEMIFLDEENLAEGGIGEAYKKLLPKLRLYVAEVVQIEEVMDNDAPRYVVRFRTMEFVIYAPEFREKNAGNSWARATHALFTIVNDQLSESQYRFFAINGGNELGGMFLTPMQAEASRKNLPRKRDWPYLPTSELPWGGMFH